MSRQRYLKPSFSANQTNQTKFVFVTLNNFENKNRKDLEKFSEFIFNFFFSKIISKISGFKYQAWVDKGWTKAWSWTGEKK